jgi:hypothetical protein
MKLLNIVHNLPSYYSEIHSDIIFPSMPRSLDLKSLCISPLSIPSHEFCMSYLSHPPWFDYSNNIAWSAQVFCNSSLCSFLHSLAIFSLLGPNILLSTLSQLLSINTCVFVEDVGCAKCSRNAFSHTECCSITRKIK